MKLFQFKPIEDVGFLTFKLELSVESNWQHEFLYYFWYQILLAGGLESNRLSQPSLCKGIPAASLLRDIYVCMAQCDGAQQYLS